jgi:hypothetical protein
MNAISSATAGMNAATQQLNAAAAQAANPTGDSVQAAIGQIEAEASFAANAAVVATTNRMIGALLDITA